MAKEIVGSVKRAWLLGLVVSALSAMAPAQAASNYVNFDVPNSSVVEPVCINAGGEVTGIAVDAGTGNLHAFLRLSSGQVTEFDAPNAYLTYVTGLNNAGAIVGYYRDGTGIERHGFLRLPDGSEMTIDVPNAMETIPHAINSSGAIAGGYVDANEVSHGFIRAANGTITTFDVKAAGTSNVQGTEGGFTRSGCNAFNDAGALTGSYIDGSNVLHGFVRAANGAITTFDQPSGSYAFYPTSISVNGTMVAGFYQDSFGSHSFTRSSNGVLTTFDPSNASASSVSSSVLGMNAAGTMVGSARFADGSSAGFVISAKGKVTFIAYPGDTTSLAASINASGAVVGVHNTYTEGYIAYPPY